MGMKFTAEEIEAAKTAKGGYSREALAKLGVPWPPPKGWRQSLLNGEDIAVLDHQERLVDSPVIPGMTAHQLLHQVVMAVVTRGHASDLYDLPEVLEFFGSTLPEKPFATIDYTNWRGERSLRRIRPLWVEYGSNEWHPEEQWLLVALDEKTNQRRTFALSQIHQWNTY
jgi:hypothetical protein